MQNRSDLLSWIFADKSSYIKYTFTESIRFSFVHCVVGMCKREREIKSSQFVWPLVYSLQGRISSKFKSSRFSARYIVRERSYGTTWKRGQAFIPMPNDRKKKKKQIIYMYTTRARRRLDLAAALLLPAEIRVSLCIQVKLLSIYYKYSCLALRNERALISTVACKAIMIPYRARNSDNPLQGRQRRFAEKRSLCCVLVSEPEDLVISTPRNSGLK